jgi:putative membrane protein
MMWGYGFNMGWMWLFGLLALAGLVLLVIVIVWVTGGGIKRNDARGVVPLVSNVGARSASRQILDERYARGELTTDEYRERLTVLGEDS